MAGVASDPLLLDTHAWVWLAFGDKARFSKKTITRIDAAAQAGKLFVAAISLWEVAMLESKGRLKFSTSCDDWLKQSVKNTGVVILPLESDVAALSCALPDFHGDPADRLIVASAAHHRAILLTEDERILDHVRKGGYRAVRLK